MKVFGTLLAFVFGLQLAWAESASVKVSDVPTDGDTSVFIKKGGQGHLLPDYEIVSGTRDVMGDPDSGLKESLANWKTACGEWKKEMKELNPDNQILVLDCGKPSSHKDESGMRTYSSSGSYRMKVRIRDSRR